MQCACDQPKTNRIRIYKHSTAIRNQVRRCANAQRHLSAYFCHCFHQLDHSHRSLTRIRARRHFTQLNSEIQANVVRAPRMRPVASLLLSSLYSLLPLCILLLCFPSVGLSSSHLNDTNQLDAVPPPLVATWSTLQQRAASDADGMPSPRCDHSFLLMTGHSQRRNTGISFGGSGQPPSEDRYRNVIWLHGGHEDLQFNDTWLLNMSAPIPTWTKMHPSEGSAAPRWGYGAAFIPNGLAAGDEGLTGIMFAGYNNDYYLGDVSTFNFGSQQQREIVASESAASDSAPFPRGYMEWVQLPKGAASGGPIDTTVDSGLFYTFGGLGSSSGIRYSAEDHSQ